MCKIVVEAFYNTALCYFYAKGVPKDEAKAAEFMKKGADLGNGGCLHECGVNHWCGYGVDEDPKKSLDYFKKAAKKDNVPSFFAVGKKEAMPGLNCSHVL